jgi:hypothetical protein
MEKLRDAYARATDPTENKRIATETQVLTTQVVTRIPLGEWYSVSAVRANIMLLNRLLPVTAFWGCEAVILHRCAREGARAQRGLEKTVRYGSTFRPA